MSQIVHITFEKLTGLKGEIEGDFIEKCNEGINSGVVVLRAYSYFGLLLSQDDKSAILHFSSQLDHSGIMNYLEHFKYETNFLIKSWSYGGGVTINSQPPN